MSSLLRNAFLAYSLFVCTLSLSCTSAGMGECIEMNGVPSCPPNSTCIDKYICCPDAELSNSTTTSIMTTTTTSLPVVKTTKKTIIKQNACVDKVNPSTGVSDCTKMASYCNDSYYNLMTQECPLTCGRCSGAGTGIAPTSYKQNCVDKVNPSTGRSDCPNRADLCNNSQYYTLMTKQCPRTCGRCTSG